MNDRVYCFEVVRVMAIVMIIACHYLTFSGLQTSIGGMLGGVGNCMFFTLSALLFGLKWEQSDFLPFKNQWVVKRFIKIASSLYPFLAFLIVAFVFFDVPFKTIDAVFNFIFLGWAFKLPGNGHLWFLTVIWLCYAIFFGFSRVNRYRWNNMFVWLLLVLLMVTSVLFVEHFNFPGHAFPILLLAAFAFRNASAIVEKIKSMDFMFLFWQFVVISSIITCVFSIYKVYQISRPLSYLFCNVEGLSVMAFLIRVDYSKRYSIISWISGITFELYLVHHGYCLGAFSVINKDHMLWSLILLLSVSLISAYIIKKIAKVIKEYLNA